MANSSCSTDKMEGNNPVLCWAGFADTGPECCPGAHLLIAEYIFILALSTTIAGSVAVLLWLILHIHLYYDEEITVFLNLPTVTNINKPCHFIVKIWPLQKLETWLLRTSQRIHQFLDKRLNCWISANLLIALLTALFLCHICRRLHFGDQTERDIRGSETKLRAGNTCIIAAEYYHRY